MEVGTLRFAIRVVALICLNDMGSSSNVPVMYAFLHGASTTEMVQGMMLDTGTILAMTVGAVIGVVIAFAGLGFGLTKAQRKLLGKKF